ncbi:MAG: BMP family ABC transporter substrate-binding protein [Oscillospiraceae bacterium]|nr:BMP family ABC transporter substrate-binding protein [Oscillospiraceae bacterium]
MKRTLAILLVLVMALCLFAACAKKEPAPSAAPANPTPAADRDAAVKFDNDSTPVDVAAVKASNADALSKTKVGFIFLHDENSTYDKNFINAAIQACNDFGVEYVLRTNIPEGQECYNAAAELVDDGCTIIFADSFGHEDFMIQAAKKFPDVQFCHATGTKAHTENLPNYHNAFATIYEGRYLAGVAAGMKLNQMIEEGKFTADEALVGYVGAFPYAEVKSGYTSWFLGVRSVCPTATMEVTFTNSWYDEALEKEAANTLIQRGCKLISQHADSMGAPTACETAGIPNVSYNGSTVDACPNTFIVSSRINWVPYMQVIIGRTAKGEKINADWTGTLANGAVELTDINTKAAAPGTVEKVAEVKAALIAGTIKVFDTSTFTVDGKKLDSYKADINDWGDFTGETEVISGGQFEESVFRSAPAFDLNIDGITIIDG